MGLAHDPVAAEDELPALDSARHAFAHRTVEILGIAKGNVTFMCGIDDGKRQRMLARPFQSGRKPEQICFGNTFVRRDCRNLRSPFG
ncbi:hypothetical protein D3C87_2061800 [compost metagenome]